MVYGVIGGLLACSAILATAPLVTPSIVTVDLKLIIKNFASDLAGKKLPEKELNVAIKNKIKNLEAFLNLSERKHHWVIVIKPVVVAGTKDITNWVWRKIKEKNNNA